jgi:16S rRNA (uracil1498-N3)-methyltransferase
VDRGDRSAVATFYAKADLVAGARLELDEAAVHHAHVRRMREGEELSLTNGRGAIASARIERISKTLVAVSIGDVTTVPQPPRLRLFVPVADRDRMLWLAEKCTELALSVWQPVMFRRSASVAPRGEGEGFEKKVRARMIAALEQSRGTWLPELLPPIALAEAIVRPNDSATDRFLLERGGAPLVRARSMGAVDVMVGPEGGIEREERALIVDEHGWLPTSLGDTTLRFETAGVVAVGILRALLAASRA